MKKCFIFTFVAFILFSTGCSTNSSQDVENIPILGKIYIASNSAKDCFDFEFVKFYDDKTFEGIHTKYYYNSSSGKNEPSYTKYYGSYELDNNSISLKMSDKSFSGAISDDYKKISFGSDSFTDWTEHIRDTDPLLAEFEK